MSMRVEITNLLPKHFMTFVTWDFTRLRPFAVELKERVLEKDECLVRESTASNYLYFLIEGKLKVEKEVIVKYQNRWPMKADDWHTRAVKDRVLYQI